MKKNITPKVCSHPDEGKVVAPSDSTINFLKTFARIIHTDKKLPGRLNMVCIN